MAVGEVKSNIEAIENQIKQMKEIFTKIVFAF